MAAGGGRGSSRRRGAWFQPGRISGTGALDAPAERISLAATAFALEAMLDEVVFIVGPVLVTSSPRLCTRRSESASALSSD